MVPPWNDWVTATTSDGSSRSIVAEGPLRIVIALLSKRDTPAQRRIMLAFPDRLAPPFRIEGEQIATLRLQLAAIERSALIPIIHPQARE